MDSRTLQIDYLSNHEEFIPAVALWLKEQWGFLEPATTLEETIAEFKMRFRPGGIPNAVVALVDGNLAGTASLIEDDMPQRPELSPWLASIYVHPDFRRRGIAEAMIERIIDEARAIGIKRLYLFTFESGAYYLKRGWMTMFKDTYFSRPVIVMSRDLVA
jgi:N-acetylglutamate synthase-like GNAT family acetyltransferase